jgi:hypothetical protein
MQVKTTVPRLGLIGSGLVLASRAISVQLASGNKAAPGGAAGPAPAPALPWEASPGARRATPHGGQIKDGWLRA